MKPKDDHAFLLLIDSCLKGHRSSQKELYRLYYAYGLNICLHYSKNMEEAKEILNDGFLKTFKHLNRYKKNGRFKAWLRRILIHAAIDYHHKHHPTRKLEIIHFQQQIENAALYNLTKEDVLLVLQQLPPSYRLIFNLHILEGFTHTEIAQKLGISVGTSKSNLAKARAKLKSLLHRWHVNPAKVNSNES